MSRVVSVSRIMNEDDIVEAFVRHNRTHLAHMIFLDNGSSDATLEILQALQDEGVPLSVFQNKSQSFNQVSANTWLYQIASQLHGADWVVLLDADEFIGGDFAATLAAVGADDLALVAPLVHFFDTKADDPEELIVPVRMRNRMISPTNVFKMIVRGDLGPGLVVDAGNHGGFLNGQPLPAIVAPDVFLAHYPRRNGWQNLQKIAMGWLKVLSAGPAVEAAGRSSHYRSPFETLRDRPRELLGNAHYLETETDPALMRDEPFGYLGGALRYTISNPPEFRAFELGLRYVEALARQHGRLLDESPEARRLVEGWNAERKFLF